MRGRKPKPTAQKLLEGNPGKRPLNTREPALPAAADDIPDEVRSDARALAEWERVAPMLRQSRVLTAADRGALIALCQQWSLYLDARSKVTSLVVTARSGYPMPNPYLGVSNKALTHCIKLWAELGCTPSSRSRVSASDAPDASDPFAEFDEEPTHDVVN
jgi:P27 family predicted phage terminase small subunit